MKALPVMHLNFLSDWSSNPHAEKEKIQKVSPFPVSPMQCNLSWRYLLGLSVLFFQNKEEKSKRTTSHADQSSYNK